MRVAMCTGKHSTAVSIAMLCMHRKAILSCAHSPTTVHCYATARRLCNAVQGCTALLLTASLVSLVRNSRKRTRKALLTRLCLDWD